MENSNPVSARPTFELKDSGEVVYNKKGKETLLANYDEETGHLEFVSKYMDEKYRPQVLRAIAEDTEGTSSDKKVKSFGIEGMEKDVPKVNEPPKPKGDKLLGDKTKAVVDWYFKFRPSEAYARYGVKLDSNGQPVMAHCRRVDRIFQEHPLTGKVELIDVITEDEEGMIATRGTHRTFLKTEVVGADAENFNNEEN